MSDPHQGVPVPVATDAHGHDHAAVGDGRPPPGYRLFRARAGVFARAVSPDARGDKPRRRARPRRRPLRRRALVRLPWVPCARGARRAPVTPSAVSPAALFEVAVPPPPLVVIPPTAAFMTCILAVLVIALLGKDEHNMLLAQIALNAPYAVTTWWLGETGKMVCFGILALRTFFGAHLSGRLDALLNCGATLGLLIITAPSAAGVARH